MKFKFTKETAKRMLKTFVDFTGDRDVVKTALIGLALSAASAGLAAIMNLQSPAEAEEE